jgi:hypothetical protein
MRTYGWARVPEVTTEHDREANTSGGSRAKERELKALDEFVAYMTSS